MRQTTWSTPELAIGVDIGDRLSHVASVRHGGEVLSEGSVKNTPQHMEEFFSEVPKGTRIVLEAGTHSPWISALLEDIGLEVVVANANHAGRAILANGAKNDKLDAILLATFGLSSPSLLRPIQHRNRQAQADLSVIRARDGLVAMRTKAINAVRGMVKSAGARLPACSAEAFHRKVPDHVPDDLKPAVGPVLEAIEQLTQGIRGYDKKVEELGKKYPETERLQRISGVGPLISLAFVLTLEDPKRFKRSRSVGAFVGLVGRQHDSGESSPQLRITKAGDSYLRRLLVTAAQHALNRNGQDCELKRFGLRLAASGGKRGKKRAVVAVARKLAVLMHRLWSSGETYEPFYRSVKRESMSA